MEELLDAMLAVGCTRALSWLFPWPLGLPLERASTTGRVLLECEGVRVDGTAILGGLGIG